MHPKERAIREKRTIEATKKNLMGPAGKLGVIARTLGSPVVRQSTYDNFNILDHEDFTHVSYEQTLSGQDGPEIYRDEIPEMDDPNIQNIGYAFDGLNRSMHLEVLYFRESHEIKVIFKGFEVYKEVASELESYAPNEEWEKNIDSLFILAKKKSKHLNKLLEKEKDLERHKAKTSVWERIKSKWGL